VQLDFLLDTHIVIWMASAPDRIPKRLLTAIEDARHRFVSHITAIEIQLKHLKNPAAFPFALEHLEVAMKQFVCTELPVTYADIKALGHLRLVHRDPFDRLLIAQAANRKFHLATLDVDILRASKKYKEFSVFSNGLLQR
jgi:PIN domain nuclease of toxin-antitoxin system